MPRIKNVLFFVSSPILVALAFLGGFWGVLTVSAIVPACEIAFWMKSATSWQRGAIVLGYLVLFNVVGYVLCVLVTMRLEELAPRWVYKCGVAFWGVVFIIAVEMGVYT